MVLATRSRLYFYLHYMTFITCPYVQATELSLPLVVTQLTAASIVT